jgi:Domain of unknown function (DUF6484)
MKPADDPFQPATAATSQPLPDDDFALLTRKPLAAAPLQAPVWGAPVLGRLAGFDLLEQPLVTGVAACPGEVLAARCTVGLRHEHIGRSVVLMFEGGDPRLPLIMGVIEPQPLRAQPLAPEATPVAVLADGERQLIDAERELVLRCGDASITLTRAGKVIIKGHYILSRSSGANKMKGASIELN